MFSHSSNPGDELVPDHLSTILHDLRPQGVSYGHCRLLRPWGVEMPAEPVARLHLVVAGESWLRAADFGPVRLRSGDVALIPRGEAHAMADTPKGRTRPLSTFPHEPIGERTFRLNGGGDGSQTLMACSSISFGQPALHPLLELMPAVLIVCRATTEDPTLRGLLDAMADEVIGQRVGSATILARLADVVIARLIRAWVEAQCGDATGWLAAIRDPKVGRALAAIHRHPGQRWSVETLADTAGLSRSMFSQRFASLVGAPPGQYLARWRMHLASRWLRDERLTVAQVADRLGYESEPAFSRAFKRLMGVPPSALRRVDKTRESTAAGRWSSVSSP